MIFLGRLNYCITFSGAVRKYDPYCRLTSGDLKLNLKFQKEINVLGFKFLICVVILRKNKLPISYVFGVWRASDVVNTFAYENMTPELIRKFRLG